MNLLKFFAISIACQEKATYVDRRIASELVCYVSEFGHKAVNFGRAVITSTSNQSRVGDSLALAIGEGVWMESRLTAGAVNEDRVRHFGELMDRRQCGLRIQAAQHLVSVNSIKWQYFTGTCE